MNAGSPSAPAISAWVKALVVLLAICSIYVFLLPYDTIADEEEYLDEAFSLANGDPTGWNIRSFVPQLILSAPVFLLVQLGVNDPGLLTAVVRATNWMYWWAGLVILFVLAKRALGIRTAYLSIFLLLANGVWLLNSKRVMMDVPAAVWLLFAIFLVGMENGSRWRAFFVPIVAGMASATKFQVGPVAVLLVLILAFQLHRNKDWKGIAAAIAGSSIFLACFGFLDFVVYGKPFVSLLNFYNYTFVNTAEFASTYGPCESASFYLTESRAIFSLILPFFILLGLLGMARSRNRLAIISLVAVLAYLLLVQNICHKQARYLLLIVPLLTLAGAHGLMMATRVLGKLMGQSRGRRLFSCAMSAMFILVICLSLVPRNEISRMAMKRESCADFVYDAVLPKLLSLGVDSAIFAAPCGMPEYYIRPIDAIYGGVGFNGPSRIKEVGEFRINLATSRAVIVQRNSLLESIVKEEWKDVVPVLKSHSREYALYLIPPG